MDDAMIFPTHLFIIKRLQRKALQKYGRLLRGRILDIGCGTGPFRTLLPEAVSYVGMDENRELRPALCGRAEALPFADGSFDGILCTEVLEHVTEPEVVLQEMRRVLKDSAHLYITVPQTWGMHYEPHDYWRFTRYGISHLLTKSGFDVVAIERIGGLFSMINQRLIETAWGATAEIVAKLAGRRWAERIASVIWCVPAIILYPAGIAGDVISGGDALGWAVLAVRRSAR